MKTKVTELLQIEYPIIQGGMAWVAEHHLAAAVSEAGGFGLIGAASTPPEIVREEIRKAKELTDKPFGVNIMLLNPNADEVAKIVVEEGIQAVTTGAGNPEKYMPMWKEAGVKVIPVVASVAMAKRMERYGAVAVVLILCHQPQVLVFLFRQFCFFLCQCIFQVFFLLLFVVLAVRSFGFPGFGFRCSSFFRCVLCLCIFRLLCFGFRLLGFLFVCHC